MVENTVVIIEAKESGRNICIIKGKLGMYLEYKTRTVS